MIVLVTGGRTGVTVNRLRQVLSSRHKKSPFTLLVTGGAKGADSSAVEWAKLHCVAFAVFPADWNRYGKQAGPIRNSLMLSTLKVETVIAFPGGKGTRDMVKKAACKGIPIIKAE